MNEAAIRQLTSAELQDRAEHWPVSGHKVLARGHVCDFVVDTVTTPEGGTMVREYTLHPGAVGVIAWDDTDRIAVVLQYRHPAAQQMVEPPAGLLDLDGEDYLDGAKRELAEEAGLAAESWQVLVDIFTSPGATQEAVRVFLARGLSTTAAPEGFVAESEEASMEVAWAPRTEVLAAILAGRVQNPVLVAGVLALEVARANGGLAALRPANAPWPSREQREAQLSRLHDALDPR
jgi:8-oxo-dGDP phosphatase